MKNCRARIADGRHCRKDAIIDGLCAFHSGKDICRCGMVIYDFYRFCPHCGRRIRRKKRGKENI
jgi:NADH pyrophosphatase NudC (nudix superfamily)